MQVIALREPMRLLAQKQGALTGLILVLAHPPMPQIIRHPTSLSGLPTIKATQYSAFIAKSRIPTTQSPHLLIGYKLTRGLHMQNHILPVHNKTLPMIQGRKG